MAQNTTSESRKVVLDTLVRRVGAAAMIAAAVFWLWSALVETGDTVATAQAQFERMSELNRYGSAAAVIAAVCAAILFLLKSDRG